MRKVPALLVIVLSAIGAWVLTGCGTQASNSLSTAPAAKLDFSLTASPTTLSLTAGVAGQTVSLNATALNGFTGSVKVSLSGLPTGVTASPSTLTLTPGTAQSITLTAAPNAAAGMATITVTGTSGSLSHTATVVLTVSAAAPAPDFTLTVAPTSLALTAGTAGQTVSVTATPLNGFTDQVSVSLSGLPTGVNASPSTLTLMPSATQSVTLTAAASAAAGNATVTFTATSGSLSHSATLQLTVNVVAVRGVDVTTYHYDNARDGLNADETMLTPSNVNAT
ncbi:MAG TPA: hypothetical protein VK729_13405, partial [Silvibacterium sp.]|nr:hypothetical protein [Silvibacterium sp.]